MTNRLMTSADVLEPNAKILVDYCRGQSHHWTVDLAAQDPDSKLWVTIIRTPIPWKTVKRLLDSGVSMTPLARARACRSLLRERARRNRAQALLELERDVATSEPSQ